MFLLKYSANLHFNHQNSNLCERKTHSTCFMFSVLLDVHMNKMLLHFKDSMLNIKSFIR